jgi:hypothetical protein
MASALPRASWVELSFWIGVGVGQRAVKLFFLLARDVLVDPAGFRLGVDVGVGLGLKTGALGGLAALAAERRYSAERVLRPATLTSSSRL